MTQDADHEKRMLYDDLDEYCESYGVFEDDQVLGSLRIVYLDDLPDPTPLIEKFCMQPAIESVGSSAICTTSRFILDQRLRHGTIVFRLMQQAYKDAWDRGARLNYGDCSPHLLPFYEHLGYRRYRRGYNDTAFGFKVPILMLMGDLKLLERVRSPLARLARTRSDDAQSRDWFESTYPDYLDIESASLLAEETFFDLLTERVASDPLHKVSLLNALDQQEAEEFLKQATLLNLKNGDLIVREGDRDSTVYVLLSGIAEVTVGDPLQPPVAVIGAGDTFGEIGFLTATPRTASVTAKKDCEVLVLSGEFLQHFITREPVIASKVLLNLSRELAGRCVLATEQLKPAN